MFLFSLAVLAVSSAEESQKPENKPEFDGRISQVNTAKNYIGVVDESNQKFRRIALKGGMINQYKVGDYVHIQLRQGMNEAKAIRKNAPPKDRESA